MTDQAALYARLHPTQWRCPGERPECTPANLCGDACRPTPVPSTQESSE